MTTRMIRNTAALVALLFGMLTLVVNPAAAQDATPSADQPVMVGDTELSWTGDWQLDPSSTVDEQATLNQVDPATGTLKLATYGEFADDSVDTAEDALDTFTTAFFEGAGVETVQETGSGELDNGAMWKMFSFDLQGLQLSLLITVNEASEGEFVVSTLTSNTDQFADSLSQAQEEIMLNGEPTFLEGVEASEITGGLEASPVATPAS